MTAKLDMVLARLDVVVRQGVRANPTLVDADWDEEAGFEQRKADWVNGTSGPRTPALQALMWHILLGDLFHNFFDGVIIAIAFRLCGVGACPPTHTLDALSLSFALSALVLCFFTPCDRPVCLSSLLFALVRG